MQIVFTICTVFLFGDILNIKSKYLSGACLLVISTVVVKVIGAVYKIPLTAFIGAVGRGYYAYAYNLVMPIHALTMGTFPIALSKLVSKYKAGGNDKMVKSLKFASTKLFSFIGFVGMLVVLLISYFYCTYISKTPKAIYTVLVLAPSVLFSSMASSYRGYFEGNMNMFPTAFSQTLEAVIKLVFGLAFAKLSMAYLFSCYQSTGYVLGVAIRDNDTALSFIYPVTSAFSMLGVTLGTFISFCFLFIYSQIKEPMTKIKNTKYAKKEILSLSYPIIFSTAIQSVFQFLENASIQIAIDHTSKSAIKNMYQNSLSLNTIQDKDLSTYIYGLLSTAMDFKNLVPGVTMALGICAVPAISRVYEIGDNTKTKSIINSVFKYTVLLSSLGGVAIAVCSNEIMSIFYGNSSPDVVIGTSDLVRYFALTVPFYSLAGTSVFVLQALGIPEKSIPAYIISGTLRVILNYILVINSNLILFGTVISGAVGYLIMSIINMIFVSKYLKISLSFKDIIFMPSLVFMCVLVIFKYLSVSFFETQNIVVSLIEKGTFVSILHIILCFLCGLLKFRTFFRDFN